MDHFTQFKAQVQNAPQGAKYYCNYLAYLGYSQHYDDPVPIARAYAIESLFTRHKKHIYDNDLVAGSIRGRITTDPISDAQLQLADRVVASYGSNYFLTNADHFAPDYKTFLKDGVQGTLDKIDKSLEVHKNDPDFAKKEVFLKAAKITMKAFSQMIRQYGEAAKAKAQELTDPFNKSNLQKIANICEKISLKAPETFHEALQLVWFVHLSFQYEGRYAMALGRLDQFLYPYYENDVKNGTLTRDQALKLVQYTLFKIGENRYFGFDDVVNIAIGGVKRDGTGGVNELSYIILEAVKNCNIPGPNLSARLYKGMPDEFLDECLKVIGTGLGYPALMNDEVNIPALHRVGYALEDCRDYCMVGCIENFIQGMQPPWSDSRYNVPKYIELAWNNGKCAQTGVQMGPQTGDVSEFKTMADFMAALEKQMAFGAAEYVALFNNENQRYNKFNYMQPYLSCYCASCIERGLDINDGGAYYPSAHGAGCMGIATVADSLAAIEEAVYNRKICTFETLKEALLADFNGYEDLRAKLLNLPKYGNNIDLVDKYAVWFVDITHKLFSKYRTWDGGAFYTAIASNVQNISAGSVIAATPDGRKNGMPLSDAASPMRHADKNGPTGVINSVTKPDYTKVACGTVLNQKYTPNMFTDPQKRAKLLALIKTYFAKGGQEMQINSVNRAILQDAMDHPENYRDLVVRVSGFSAYYTQLDRSVQLDILQRTEHGA